MYKKYTVGFKEQAVEKALMRTRDTTLKEVSLSLNVIPSTLRNWVEKANKHKSSNTLNFTKEKRPEQWNFEERLNMIIACGSLDDEATNECCRKQGIYPHHVKQWKQDFVTNDMKNPTNKAYETNL